jgi:hypothetical protein
MTCLIPGPMCTLVTKNPSLSTPLARYSLKRTRSASAGETQPSLLYEACPVKDDVSPGLERIYLHAKKCPTTQTPQSKPKSKEISFFQGPVLCPNTAPFPTSYTAPPVVDLCSFSQEVHRIGNQSPVQLLARGSVAWSTPESCALTRLPA